MQKNQLKDLLKDFGNNVVFDQDLKKKNWFNIGGKSKVFFRADNLKDLVKFLQLLSLAILHFVMEVICFSIYSLCLVPVCCNILL